MDREKERERRLRLKMLPMARVGNVSSNTSDDLRVCLTFNSSPSIPLLIN